MGTFEELLLLPGVCPNTARFREESVLFAALLDTYNL